MKLDRVCHGLRGVKRVVPAAAVLLFPQQMESQQIKLSAPRPVLTIEATAQGGDSVVFGTLIGATRLSDGTIVAADPTTPAILYFDRSARVIGVAGRRGGGPGEFRSIRWIGQCVKDTIFAFEQARLQVFTNRGKVVRTIDAGGHLPGQLFCNRTGVIAAVGAGDWEAPGAPGVRRVMASGWTFGTDGKLLKEIGDVPVTDAAWDGTLWEAVPLGRQMFMTLDGSDVIMGNAESNALSVFTPNSGWHSGPSLGSIEMREPTESEIDAGILTLVALAPHRHAKSLHERFKRLPRPKNMPTYHRLVSDGHGRIWAQLTVVGTSPTRLRWVDRRNGRVGDLSIPAALIVQEIGSDYILAIEELPSGAQRIVEYALTSR